MDCREYSTTSACLRGRNANSRTRRLLAVLRPKRWAAIGKRPGTWLAVCESLVKYGTPIEKSRRGAMRGLPGFFVTESMIVSTIAGNRPNTIFPDPSNRRPQQNRG